MTAYTNSNARDGSGTRIGHPARTAISARLRCAIKGIEVNAAAWRMLLDLT